MKASSATEAILVVGMVAISALMLTQLPATVKDVSNVLAVSSAVSTANEIASLISTAGAASGRIEIQYKFPTEAIYNLRFKDNYIKVDVYNKELKTKIEGASVKIPIDMIKDLENVKAIKITKFVENGKIRYEIDKVE